MKPMRNFTIAALSAIALSATATMAKAEVGIELNKLEGNDSGCLAYMLINNASDAELDSLVLDLYTFDGNGIIGENLAVQLAPIPSSKLSVKGVQFGAACDGIARILVNSVPACTSAGAPVEGCAASLTLSSKAAVELAQ